MPRTASAEEVEAIRSALQKLRDSGDHYPCPEPDFIRLVGAGNDLKPATVRRLLAQDTKIARYQKHKKTRAPFFLAFAGDERLIFAVDDKAIKETLERSEKPLSAEEIASLLGLSVLPLALTCLSEQLDRMARDHSIQRRGTTYEAPRRSRDLEVIETIGFLKREGSYPVSAKGVAERMPPPKTTGEKLKAVLESLTKTGALRKVRMGRFVLYLFGGDDPRYAEKATEALKCELLAEIEELQSRLAEYRQSAVNPALPEPAPATAPTHESVPGQVLACLDETCRLSGRRTIELWELRRQLTEIPRESLDQTLQDLGRSRVLELKPVQDVTRLSDAQRESLLALADGTMVLSVARFDREG